MGTMRVRFLGGPGGMKRFRPAAGADPVAIGDEVALDERVIRRLRGRRYLFAAIEETPLPDPEPQEPPEQHHPQAIQPQSPIEVVKR